MSDEFTDLSTEELLRRRAAIDAAIKRRADALRETAAALEAHCAPPLIRKRTNSLKGTKVPPKYRSVDGQTWTGRGYMPVWLRHSLSNGHKLDDFKIADH